MKPNGENKRRFSGSRTLDPRPSADDGNDDEKRRFFTAEINVENANRNEDVFSQRFMNFAPLEPPASKCPKCLGWWADRAGRAIEPKRKTLLCPSHASCPDGELCESLYGDLCVVVVDESGELPDLRTSCWAWEAGEKPCLACGAEDCPDRRA